MKKRILEVGSGNSPKDESWILTDRLLYDNSQRAGKFNINVDRLFVVADGYSLPFKDKYFDFVYCTHVLEHLRNPVSFAKELQRVAKEGYIEVPSIHDERLFGWDFHLWYCQIKNSSLVFNPKREGLRYAGFFHRLMESSINFRNFFEKNESFFHIQFHWKDNIKIKVNKENLDKAYLDEIDRQAWEKLTQNKNNKFEDFYFYIRWILKRLIKKTKKVVRKTFWSFKTSIMENKALEELLPSLICPTCKNDTLELKKGGLSCTSCLAYYKIDHHIPVLLLKHEEKKGY